MIKFIPCRKCIGKNGRNPEGYIIKKVPAGDGKTMVDVAEECSCHKAWREATKLEAQMQKANISIDAAKYNISDYVGTKSIANVERLKKFTARSTDKHETQEVKDQLASSCLYIYGKNGTQKTTLAMWMGYQFLKAGKKVKYILMNDLLKLLTKAERDEDIQAQLEKLADVDLLIIDEAFDKEKVTIFKSNFQIPYLDTFLRNRIQSKKKGIVFISNVLMEDIEANKFNKSIQDLVIRNVNISKGFMEFEDNYMDLKGAIDVDALF